MTINKSKLLISLKFSRKFLIDLNDQDIAANSPKSHSILSGLPFVHNEVFIPANTYLDDVSNTNGTLTHGGKSLSQYTSQI